jgi:DNA-binding NarL/FixJ family response regulator/signal transduction histidine kinase
VRLAHQDPIRPDHGSGRAPPGEARPESQGQIATILESITDAFYALDGEFRFTYLNARAVSVQADLLNREMAREDFLGRRVFDVFPPLARPDAQEQFRAAASEHRTIVFEVRLTPSGRWLDIHISPGEQGLSVYFREITDRKSAEADRERRALQQALIAELGLRAAATDDLQELMDGTAALVADGLDVELVAVAEVLDDDTGALVLRAGVGWGPGAMGRSGSLGSSSLVGYTVMTGDAVVSEDVTHDERFSVSPFLAGHKPVSAAAIAIAGREEPFGALAVFAREQRTFSDDDINFLHAMANVLYTAVERAQAAEALHDVREAERRRLARALHDEAMQDLSYAMALAADPEQAGRADEPLLRVLQRVSRQLRGAVYDLRLADERDRPFGELLAELVEVHRTMATSMDIVLAPESPASALGDLGTEVLRILGESLTNARRHAAARRVDVRVWATAGALCAEVTDDGDGFEPDARAAPGTESRGLTGMRERAELLGGRLDVRTALGTGTTVHLRVPMGTARRAGETVHVLLVEDHAAVRESMAAAFAREPGFEVVAHAGSLAEARRRLRGVDVAIVDLGLPDGNGADLIPDLRAENADAQALVLSAGLDRSAVAAAVERGAAGALSKDAHLRDVVNAVRRLRAGETLMPIDEVVELLGFARRERHRELDDRRALETLTPRERQILQLLAEGLDTQRSATRLHISPRTHRNHVSKILMKLGVHSQLQAVVFALRYELVDVGVGVVHPRG